MTAVITYNSLLTDLQAYLERGSNSSVDPVVFNQLPRLVNLGERRCARTLKIQYFQTAATNAFQSGVSVYQKPDRWRVTVSINYGTGASNATRTPLYARSLEQCRAYWPNETIADPAHPPVFYADYGPLNWWISPTPSAANPFEVVYYEEPMYLDPSNQTNYLTTFCPQMLLYACLVEATPFLKNDDRIPVWSQMFEEAATLVNGEDIQKIVDREGQRKAA